MFCLVCTCDDELLVLSIFTLRLSFSLSLFSHLRIRSQRVPTNCESVILLKDCLQIFLPTIKYFVLLSLSSLGLDQICSFFLPVSLFVLNICIHFTLQCTVYTHFAIYRSHFASYFNVKFQHYYVIKLPKIHQTKKTMNVKHQW